MPYGEVESLAVHLEETIQQWERNGTSLRAMHLLTPPYQLSVMIQPDDLTKMKELSVAAASTSPGARSSSPTREDCQQGPSRGRRHVVLDRDDITGGFGLTIRPEDGVVLAVRGGLPASRSGIRVGDRILSGSWKPARVTALESTRNGDGALNEGEDSPSGKSSQGRGESSVVSSPRSREVLPLHSPSHADSPLLSSMRREHAHRPELQQLRLHVEGELLPPRIRRVLEAGTELLGRGLYIEEKKSRLIELVICNEKQGSQKLAPCPLCAPAFPKPTKVLSEAELVVHCLRDHCHLPTAMLWGDDESTAHTDYATVGEGDSAHRMGQRRRPASPAGKKQTRQEQVALPRKWKMALKHAMQSAGQSNGGNNDGAIEAMARLRSMNRSPSESNFDHDSTEYVRTGSGDSTEYVRADTRGRYAWARQQPAPLPIAVRWVIGDTTNQRSQNGKKQNVITGSRRGGRSGAPRLAMDEEASSILLMQGAMNALGADIFCLLLSDGGSCELFSSGLPPNADHTATTSTLAWSHAEHGANYRVWVALCPEAHASARFQAAKADEIKRKQRAHERITSSRSAGASVTTEAGFRVVIKIGDNHPSVFDGSWFEERYLVDEPVLAFDFAVTQPPVLSTALYDAMPYPHRQLKIMDGWGLATAASGAAAPAQLELAMIQLDAHGHYIEGSHLDRHQIVTEWRNPDSLQAVAESDGEWSIAGRAHTVAGSAGGVGTGKNADLVMGNHTLTVDLANVAPDVKSLLFLATPTEMAVTAAEASQMGVAPQILLSAPKNNSHSGNQLDGGDRVLGSYTAHENASKSNRGAVVMCRLVRAHVPGDATVKGFGAGNSRQEARVGRGRPVSPKRPWRSSSPSSGTGPTRRHAIEPRPDASSPWPDPERSPTRRLVGQSIQPFVRGGAVRSVIETDRFDHPNPKRRSPTRAVRIGGGWAVPAGSNPNARSSGTSEAVLEGEDARGYPIRPSSPRQSLGDKDISVTVTVSNGNRGNGNVWLLQTIGRPLDTTAAGPKQHHRYDEFCALFPDN